MNMIKIGVCGSNGKMGQSIIELINGSSEFQLTSGLTKLSSEEDIIDCAKNSDIILDFSHPDALESITKILALSRTPLLVGTTNLGKKHFDYLENLSKLTAVLYAPNTSLGANLLSALSACASSVLKNYDVEIVESHHRDKKDAPSGTALMIGQQIAKSSGLDFDEVAVFDRASRGKRENGQIGFSSIRGGGIWAENEVLLAGNHEVLTIGCRALSRHVFAEGALSASKWLIEQKNGLYSMQDFMQIDQILANIYGTKS